MNLLLINLILITLDRLTKQLVVNYPQLLVKNSSFYFLPPAIFYLLASVTIMIFLFLTYYYLKKKNYSLALGASLIASAGISNLFDRLYFGYIIDWINLAFWPTVFNLADVIIVIGLACLGYKYLLPFTQKLNCLLQKFLRSLLDKLFQ